MRNLFVSGISRTTHCLEKVPRGKKNSNVVLTLCREVFKIPESLQFE